MKFPYEEFDLSGVRTYPLASRTSKANAADFGKPYRAESGVRGLLDSFPQILAAADFRAVVAAIGEARAGDRGIIWGLGAHVIKTGLAPIVIDLMERGFVSAIATNGAGIIHDFEVALSGGTSEDVDEALGPGRFGMADETGRLLNAAINERRSAAGLGIGRGGRASILAGAAINPRRRSATSACWRFRGAARAFRCHRARGDRDRHHPHAPRARPARRSGKAACATSR